MRAVAFAPSPVVNNALHRAAAAYAVAANESIYVTEGQFPTEYDAYSTIVSGLGVADVVPLFLGAGRTELIETGAVVNVSAAWETYGLDDDVFGSAQSLPRSSAGVPHGVPMMSVSSMCLFRRSILSSLGLDPRGPQGWNEFLAACRVFVAAGRSCFGADFGDIAPSAVLDKMLISMHGDAFYQAFATGVIPFTDPRLRETFEIFIAEFVTTGAVAREVAPDGRVLMSGIEDYTVRFLTGQVGFACGVHVMGEFYIGAGIPFSDLGTIPVPAYPFATSSNAGPRRGVTGATVFITAPTASPLVDRARAFLHFMADPVVMRDAVQGLRFAIPLYQSLTDTVSDNSTLEALEDAKAASAIMEVSGISAFGDERLFVAWYTALNTVFGAESGPVALEQLDIWIETLEAERLAAVLGQAARPTLSPAGGSFSGPVEISMLTATSQGLILYTLDGSPPSRVSPEFTGPIILSSSGSVTIRAMTSAPNLRNSAEVSAVYVVDISSPSTSSNALYGTVQDSTAESRTLILAVTIPVAACLLAVILGVGYVIYRRRTVTHKLISDGELVIPWEELEVGAPVGQGSYGVVYRAIWRATPVAVKRAHRKVMAAREMKDFVAEASTLMRLRHPCITILMGVTLEPASLVTEFCERGTLFSVLHSPLLFLDASIVYKWSHQMAQGLQFLASAGVIHGDFKSLNVLFDSNWTPKIADFGLSPFRADLALPPTPKAPQNLRTQRSYRVGPAPESSSGAYGSSEAVLVCEGETSSEASHNVGTLFWSAPEVIMNGKAGLSHAADAFAFGIVLWELASRKMLYEKKTGLQVARMVALEGLRPDLQGLRPVFDPLTSVARQLWAQDMEARMTVSQAEVLMRDMYSQDNVVYPSAVASPQGRVWGLQVRVPRILSWMREDPDPAADALALFHTEVRAVLEGLGTILRWDLASVTMCAHKPEAMLEIAEGIFAALGVSVPMVMFAAEGHVTRSPDVSRVNHGVGAGPIMEELDGMWASSTQRVQDATGSLFLSDGIADDVLRMEKNLQTAEGIPFSFMSMGIALPAPSRAILDDPEGHHQVAILSANDVCGIVEGSPLKEEPYMGSFAKVTQASLTHPDISGEAAPVLVKILLRQDYNVERLVGTARTLFTAARVSRTASSLASPLGVCLETPYVSILVPYWAKGTLQDMYRSPAMVELSPQQRRSLALNLAQALADLHGRMPHGRGHGCLQPSNILVDPQEDSVGVQLVDFGMTYLQDSARTMTATPAAAYAAPEELEGHIGFASSDLFVFGTLMYEICTLHSAFSGRNTLAVAMRIVRGDFPILDDTRMSNAVIDIISSVWKQSPAERVTVANLVDMVWASVDEDWALKEASMTISTSFYKTK